MVFTEAVCKLVLLFKKMYALHIIICLNKKNFYLSHRNEAMTDLIALLDTLLDKDGKILIPGIIDDVEPLTEEECALYRNIEFDLNEYQKEVDSPKLLQDSKVNLKMCLLTFSSISPVSLKFKI